MNLLEGMPLELARRRGEIYLVRGFPRCTTHGRSLTAPKEGIRSCPERGCPVAVLP